MEFTRRGQIDVSVLSWDYSCDSTCNTENTHRDCVTQQYPVRILIKWQLHAFALARSSNPLASTHRPVYPQDERHNSAAEPS